MGDELVRPAPHALELVWRNIVENESDPVLGAFIHHAVGLLIVDLVCEAHLKTVWPAINHEPNSRISPDKEQR